MRLSVGTPGLGERRDFVRVLKAGMDLKGHSKGQIPGRLQSTQWLSCVRGLAGWSQPESDLRS